MAKVIGRFCSNRLLELVKKRLISCLYFMSFPNDDSAVPKTEFMYLQFFPSTAYPLNLIGNEKHMAPILNFTSLILIFKLANFLFGVGQNGELQINTFVQSHTNKNSAFFFVWF